MKTAAARICLQKWSNCDGERISKKLDALVQEKTKAVLQKKRKSCLN
jgi:hypothetical protein